MSRFTLTTGVDRVVLTGGVNRITAATDTLSAGDVIVAPAASDTALVLDSGNRFDLSAPAVLSGVSVIRDHTVGNSVITLRDGLDLTLHLGVDNATVYGADNADRIVGGPAGGSATVVLGSARESVRAGPGGATVRMDTQTAGADIGGKGRTTIVLTGRYGDAITLGHEVRGVSELDVLSGGLKVDLGQAGVATVALSASGIALTAGAAVRMVSDYAGGNTIVFAGADQTLLLPYASLDPLLAPDRVVGFASGDTIDLAMPFSAAERLSYEAATGRLTLTNPVSQVSETVMLTPHLEGALHIGADGGLVGGYQGTAIRLGDGAGAAAPCFAAGTRVLADRGFVRVEDFSVGDRLITARGGRRRLRWIGYRTVECARHPRPAEVWPVRIVAGAFAVGLPAADVVLSPDHAVMLEGALVPVKYLVNGATVRVERVERVRYYHLELASHDVVLAEGLPVETYLDTGNRHQFSNDAGHVALHPCFAANGWSDAACAPLVTGGEIVRKARASLLARAGALGHETTGDADVHLLADGRQRIWGTVANGIWTGWAPPGVRTLRLMSRAAAPADCAVESDDYRRLGVAISKIVVRGGNVVRSRTAADAGWGAGFYAEERDEWSSWRWTGGDGEIPPALWRDIAGGFRVDLHLFRTLTYRCAPARQVMAAG